MKSRVWHRVSNLQPTNPDLLLCFVAIISKQDLAISMVNTVGPHQVSRTLGDHFAVVASKLSRTESKTKSTLSQSLCSLKEFAAHLLKLYAPATEHYFCFRRKHLGFPSGLPSKYYSCSILVNFSVQI